MTETHELLYGPLYGKRDAVTFSLKITNGDLELGSSSFGIIQGTQKLVQDLSLWLKESYGVDKFHPSYGSVLETFIGGVSDPSTMMQIQNEVARVLDLFMKYQVIAVQANPGVFSQEEILDHYNSIDCSANYDVVYVAVHFVTAAGTQGQVTGVVTP